MEHSYLDELAYRDGPIHRLDARTKLLTALSLIVTAVLIPSRLTWPFAVLLAVLLAAMIVTRLPLSTLLSRAAVFAPFILTAVILVPFTRRGDGSVAAAIPLPGTSLPVYREGLIEAKAILLKSSISAFSVLILVSTTRFVLILKAMESLHFPRTLLVVISFLYRYLFLLVGEFKRLTRAAHSRNWRAGRWSLRMSTAGGIIGSLFLRAYARGERVYLAMLSRGFDGSVQLSDQPAMRARDAATLVFSTAACAALLMASL